MSVAFLIILISVPMVRAETLMEVMNAPAIVAS